MRLYLDEDLSPRIAERLRRKGYDAVSAIEVENTQCSDWEQLAYAARERRSLVTRNGRHFLVLANDAVRRQEPHSGIIICPPSIRGFEVSEIVSRLLRLAKRYPEGLGGYDMTYL
jgi:predicted nuclease of predicted toxin-antitoxin system